MTRGITAATAAVARSQLTEYVALDDVRSSVVCLRLLLLFLIFLPLIGFDLVRPAAGARNHYQHMQMESR